MVNSWQENLVYRWGTYFWLIIHFIPILVMFSLWRAVYNQVDVYNGYTFAQIFTYYFASLIVDRLTFSWPGEMVAGEIKNGYITKFLIKPISYLGETVSFFISNRIFQVVFSLPVVIFIGWLLRAYVSAPTNLLAFLITCFLVFFLYFSFWYIIGLLAFWVVEGRQLAFAIQTLVTFFSGAVLPFEFYPPIARSVLSILPFQYFTYFPAQVYMGRVDLNQLPLNWLIMLAWTAIFFTLSAILWNRGIRRYEAIGQ